MTVSSAFVPSIMSGRETPSTGDLGANEERARVDSECEPALTNREPAKSSTANRASLRIATQLKTLRWIELFNVVID
jgi:hypothetical protein